MLCEKCGTENKPGATYCKKCGEDILTEAELLAIANASDEATEKTVEEVKEEVLSEEEKKAPVALKEADDRVRTSPLAVRIQEKNLKEDKKIKKKLKRGKVWASIAIIILVLFLAENTVLVLNKLGYIGNTQEVVKEEVSEVTNVPETPIFLNSETIEGEWNYTYRLKKNWDSDASGDYETVTEIIESLGTIYFVDKGNNHMAAVLTPDVMTVDGAALEVGGTPEAFMAWYENGNLALQFKGTEQKFIAPGGAEPLTVRVPVSMDAEGIISGGTYEYTYDKTVTEMNMRYEISVSLEKVY